MKKGVTVYQSDNYWDRTFFVYFEKKNLQYIGGLDKYGRSDLVKVLDSYILLVRGAGENHRLYQMESPYTFCRSDYKLMRGKDKDLPMELFMVERLSGRMKKIRNFPVD